MVISIAEFLRRFELHFLPKRFVKIRHYVFLQNHGKTARLNAVRKQMDLPPLPPNPKPKACGSSMVQTLRCAQNASRVKWY